MQTGILSFICYWITVDVNSLWLYRVHISHFKLFEYSMTKAAELWSPHFIHLLFYSPILSHLITGILSLITYQKPDQRIKCFQIPELSRKSRVANTFQEAFRFQRKYCFRDTFLKMTHSNRWCVLNVLAKPKLLDNCTKNSIVILQN